MVKNVEIKTISGKPNFSDNPVLKSVGNGEYQTNVTANTMSDIILTAQAGNNNYRRAIDD